MGKDVHFWGKCAYGHVCQVLVLIVKSDFWRGLQSPPRNRVSQYSAARALHNLAFCRGEGAPGEITRSVSVRRFQSNRPDNVFGFPAFMHSGCLGEDNNVVGCLGFNSSLAPPFVTGDITCFT